jgi:hypothetical protein
VEVSLEALVERFRQGLAEHGPLWRGVLAPATFEAVAALAAQPVASFTFHFAVAFQRAAGAQRPDTALPDATALLDALTPLYFGRTAGLVVDTLPFDEPAFEAYLERQAQVFEREKPYRSSAGERVAASRSTRWHR